MKTYLLIAAAAVSHPAVLSAQTTPVGAGFQQAQTLGTIVSEGRGGRGGGGMAIGKPYSATAVTHTVQVLADGSQIENTRSQVIYRDDQGRTRTEFNDGKIVQILDPVAGASYNINTVTRTARSVTFMHDRGVKVTTPQSPANGTASSTEPPAVTSALRDAVIQLDMAKNGTPAEQAGRRSHVATEDLGIQAFYGLQAHGIRTTSTIPVGAIGNNRELKNVTDLWESKDLGILVKSVNTDPRFGTTTYELTNISTSSPDPSLFRVPAGYTVEQMGKQD